MTQYNISSAGFVICNNACDAGVFVNETVWANATEERFLVGQQLYSDSGGTIPWAGGTNTYHRISIVGGSGFGYSVNVDFGGVVTEVFECTSTVPGICSILSTPTPTPTPTNTPTVTPLICDCYYYDVVTYEDDILRASGNTDTSRNGLIFVTYRNCADTDIVTTSFDNTASPYQNAICVNGLPLYNPPTIYIWQDNVQVSVGLLSFVTQAGCCSEPTPTPTPTQTQTPTVTITPTSSNTPTPTSTITPTDTPTSTPTNTPTPTETPTNTPTPSVTLTPGLSPTPTPTNTLTPTPTNTNTPTQTIAVTPTNTPTPSPTNTPFPTPVYVLKNDCNVFTLFPLGVECVTVNQPSSSTSVDGVLSINITGGTGPYTINWSNGQNTRTLGGLKQGSYEVIVTDFYGDFTSSTICSLIAPSQTPTPTPTVTPTRTPAPSYPNLCLIMQSTTISGSPMQFIYSGIINNRPSWVSGSYVMSWSGTRWQVNGYTISGGILVSTTTSMIPTSNWTIVGSTLNPIPVISVIQGTCPPVNPLNFTVSLTNSDCTNNGSIIVSATGGYPPYVYSKDGGTSFVTSPVFNNLAPQTYYLVVRDSSGTTINSTQVISPVSSVAIQTYDVSVSNYSEDTVTPQYKRAYWKVNVNPPLPVGVNLNFVLNVQSIQDINGPGSGITTNLTQVISGGTFATSSSQITGTTTTVRTNCSPFTTQENTSVVTYNLTTNSSQIISGITNSNLTITSGLTGSNGCVTNVEQTVRVYITQATITGCNCCRVNLDSNAAGGITNHSINFGQGQNTQLYYPVVLGLGTSPAGACSDYLNGITRLMNSPTFGPNVGIFTGSPGNPQVATAYSYVVYNGEIFEMSNGFVTFSTAQVC